MRSATLSQYARLNCADFSAPSTQTAGPRENENAFLDYRHRGLHRLSSLRGACSREGHDVVGFDGMTPYYDVSAEERAARDSERARTHFVEYVAMLENMAALEKIAEKHAGPTSSSISRRRRGFATASKIRAPISTPISSAPSTSWRSRARSAAEHLLFASTSSVYGANTDMPFSRARARGPSADALRRDQEGDRRHGAFLCASLENPDDDVPLLHRLRSLGPARHGAVQIRRGDRRPASRSTFTTRQDAARLHLYRRSRREHRPPRRLSAAGGRAGRGDSTRSPRPRPSGSSISGAARLSVWSSSSTRWRRSSTSP